MTQGEVLQAQAARLSVLMRIMSGPPLQSMGQPQRQLLYSGQFGTGGLVPIADQATLQRARAEWDIFPDNSIVRPLGSDPQQGRPRYEALQGQMADMESDAEDASGPPVVVIVVAVVLGLVALTALAICALFMLARWRAKVEHKPPAPVLLLGRGVRAAGPRPVSAAAREVKLAGGMNSTER